MSRIPQGGAKDDVHKAASVLVDSLDAQLKWYCNPSYSGEICVLTDHEIILSLQR
jgi:hypothetical protein